MNSWDRLPPIGPLSATIGIERRPIRAKGAQVGDEHPVVGMLGALEIEVEGIGVLHQEFAPAHHAEARPHLVTELPLDVIEVERQVLVGPHIAAEDLGDHFLVGRPVEHVALVPVLDPQHLLAIGLVAAAFAPEVGGLDGRHQKLDGAGPVLLLADDAADLVEDAQSERQEGIDAGGLLADHAGPQHEPVGRDLGLFGRLAQNGQEIAGKAHEIFGRVRKDRVHNRPQRRPNYKSGNRGRNPGAEAGARSVPGPENHQIFLHRRAVTG